MSKFATLKSVFQYTSHSSMGTGVDRPLPIRKNAAGHSSVVFHYSRAMQPYALTRFRLQIVALVVIWAQTVQMVFGCTCCQQGRNGVVDAAIPSCCVAKESSGRKPGDKCPCGCLCLRLRVDLYCPPKISGDSANENRLAKSPNDILALRESVCRIRRFEHDPSLLGMTSDRSILLCRLLL